MLAECFKALGVVFKTVLADRMGCLKGGVVAGVVVPSPDYVWFATHYRFRPDFCHAADPDPRASWRTWWATPRTTCWSRSTSKDEPWAAGLAGLNERAVAWCEEVNTAPHSEIYAVPIERGVGAGPLGELPPLRLEVGPKPTTRKVDKLSCIRFGSARYSVPNRLIGTVVTVLSTNATGCCG